MAQTKLRSHVEAQNTKISGIQYCRSLLQEGFKFLHLKYISQAV